MCKNWHFENWLKFFTENFETLFSYLRDGEIFFFEESRQFLQVFFKIGPNDF
jgi:hypothetical protein